MRRGSSYSYSVIRRLDRRISALVLLLCSCTQVPAPGPVPSDEPVAFAVDAGTTKGAAQLVTLDALNDVDFGVSAWYMPQGETFEADGVHAAKYIENQRFGYLNSAWRGVSRNGATLSQHQVYWPLDGTLTFFCYAPYQDGSSDIRLAMPPDDMATREPDWLVGSPIICVTPAAADGTAVNQVDFLAAPALLDKARSDNAGVIAVDFTDHRLTRVSFSFNYYGELLDSEHAYVESIELNNVVGSRYFYYTEATPYVMDCAWSDAVSPDDPDHAHSWPADWPRATYRLVQGTVSPAVEKGLITGTDSFLPKYDPNDLINYPLVFKSVCTEQGVLCLLPQDLPADATLTVRYVTSEQHGLPMTSDEITVNLSTALASWPAGKQVHYKMTLNIPNHQISGLTAQVEGWDDSFNDHSTQELLPHD